jgi:uncharacterized protein (TIRG00374 family)
MRIPYKKILIGLVVVLLVAIAYHSRHKINLANFTWRGFVQAVSQANIPLLLLSLASIYVCYAIRTLRWQRFSRYLGPSRFLDTYSGTLMGFTAIFLLARPGEAVRPLILAGKMKCPVSSMFGIWVLERIFDFAAAFALAVLSLLVFSGRLSDAGADSDVIYHARTAGWLMLGGLIVLIALPVYYRLHGASNLDRMIASWHTVGGWKQRLAGVISGLSEGIQAIRTVPDLLLAISYTVAHWTLVAFIYLWVSKAFGDAFPHSEVIFPGAMLLLAITLVGGVLQLPGVGGGPQIACFIGLTKVFGASDDQATAIAIALWLITFAAVTLAGIPLLIHQGLSLGQLRQLARAEAKAEAEGTHVPETQVPDLAGDAPKHHELAHSDKDKDDKK